MPYSKISILKPQLQNGYTYRYFRGPTVNASDKKIVTYMYIDSRGKGCRSKEDFDLEELEAAIELCKEQEEDDK